MFLKAVPDHFLHILCVNSFNGDIYNNMVWIARHNCLSCLLWRKLWMLLLKPTKCLTKYFLRVYPNKRVFSRMNLIERFNSHALFCCQLANCALNAESVLWLIQICISKLWMTFQHVVFDNPPNIVPRLNLILSEAMNNGCALR